MKNKNFLESSKLAYIKRNREIMDKIYIANFKLAHNLLYYSSGGDEK